MGSTSVAGILEQLKNVNDRLTQILGQLEQLNGKVHRHEQWMAAREQICAKSCETLDRAQTALQGHQSFIDQHRGGMTAAAWIANMIGATIAGAAVLLGHYLGKIQ